MPGEDIQNQCRAVNDFDLLAQNTLQFALLARREFVVKDNNVCAQFEDEHMQFLDFPCADQRRRIGFFQPLRYSANHGYAGSLGQQGELCNRVMQREKIWS